MHHGHIHSETPHVRHGENFDFGDFVICKMTEGHYRVSCNAEPVRWSVNSFFYLTRGEMFVEIDNNSVLLKSGDLVIIPANVQLTIKYYRETAGFMGSFTTDFVTDASGNVEDKYQFLRYHNSHRFTFVEPQIARINDIFESLVSVFQMPNRNDKLLKTYMSCLLEELMLSQGSLVATKPNNALTHDFLDLLFDAETQGLKPNDYAQKLGVSVNHLNKVVSKSTSKSVSKWIDERLMVHAKVLLRDVSLSIADVAFRLNFEDQSYFARKFKQQVGISASEFRKKYAD